MRASDHVRLTAQALKLWFIAQTKDSVAVALLWLVGLEILRVPGAPLWAAIAFFLQYIPNFGPVLTLVGPLAAEGIAGILGGNWMRLLYVLILYAVIAIVDGLVLQPYIMKRTVLVPIWASILTPIVLGFFLGFWGVLLSAPLLAVVYAYKRRQVVQSSIGRP